MVFTVSVLTLGAVGCRSPAGGSDAVILVSLDGLRWQDVFRGADSALIGSHGGEDEADRSDVRSRYWRAGVEARRRTLMPFLWGTVVDSGRIYGNRDDGSTVRVSNSHLFSYPGYNEMLTGAPDPRIDSNDKINNPNVTVLEWIHGQPGFDEAVAVFASWDVFPFIVNQNRAGLTVHAGWEAEPTGAGRPNPVLDAVLRGLPRVWPTVRFDALTVQLAIDHYQRVPTRVLYVALDETDTQAHAGRYDLYLDAMGRLDDGLRRLWEMAQADRRFGGRTTMIVTSDHGRGRTRDDWTDHGRGPAGADETWWAIVGPYTEPGGVMSDVAEVTVAQTAAVVATAVGLDYPAAATNAQPIVPGSVHR